MNGSEEEIRSWAEDRLRMQTLVICCGLGGESGKTISTVKCLIDVAERTSKRVILCAMTPFRFESRERIANAVDAIKSLEAKNVELICFNNNILLQMADRNASMHKVLGISDLLLFAFAQILISDLQMKKRGRYEFFLEKDGTINVYGENIKERVPVVAIKLDEEKEKVSYIFIRT